MNKPYAESTLRKKYRETDIPKESIKTLQTYLRACANFYCILEIEDVWRVVGARCGMNREAFDRLISIMARDDSLPFYIEKESEFYEDGQDKLILISKPYLCVSNDKCSEEDFARFTESLGEHRTTDKYQGIVLKEKRERYISPSVGLQR